MKKHENGCCCVDCVDARINPTNNNRGGKRPNAGRKPTEVQKVRLSTWVLPSTKAALGDKPGAKLDEDYSATLMPGSSE
jgi:hypothetical protein